MKKEDEKKWPSIVNNNNHHHHHHHFGVVPRFRGIILSLFCSVCVCFCQLVNWDRYRNRGQFDLLCHAWRNLSKNTDFNYECVYYYYYYSPVCLSFSFYYSFFSMLNFIKSIATKIYQEKTKLSILLPVFQL